MSALSVISSYWLNFLLHTALLSAFVWVLCLLLRDPGKRAFAAVLGIFSIVLLPWVSALRPIAPVDQPQAGIPEKIESRDWSGWTIRISNPTPLPSHPAPLTETSPVVATTEPLDWSKILFGLWISGTAIGLTLLTVRLVRFRIWSATLRTPSREEQALLESISPKDEKRFLISSKATGPCAIGFFRLRMVVPESLIHDRDTTKLRWVVRHEAEHLRSGDPRMALLLSLVKCAAWWNPTLHLLAASWAEDRERVCDARSLSEPDEGRHYGTFLLDLTELKSCPAGTPMAMSGGARRMKKRLRALVQEKRVAPLSTVFRISAILSTIAGAAVIATGQVRTTTDEIAEKLLPNAEAFVSPEIIQRSTVEPIDASETGQQPQLLKVTASFVQTKETLKEAGAVLTYAEYQLMMQGIAQQAGNNLVILPSTSVSDGMKATLTAVHIVPGERDSDDVRTIPFVGISASLSPKLEGKKAALSVNCQMNFEPDKIGLVVNSENPNELWPVPAHNLDWKTIRSVTLKATRSLTPGDYLILPLEGLPEGVHITGIFTVQVAEPAEIPKVKPLESKPRIPLPTKLPEIPEGAKQVPVLVKISTKLILTDKPILEVGTVIDEKKMFLLMREYSETEGVKLLTTPSMMARPSQNGKVEIVREAPDGSNFIGLSHETLGEISGDQLILSIDSIYNYGSGSLDRIFEDGGLSQDIPASFNWTNIRSARAKAKVPLKTGQSYVLAYEGVEGGKHLTAFCEVLATDGNGKTVKSFAELIPVERSNPAHEIPREGKVIIRSAIINLPREDRLPSYLFYMGERQEKAADGEGKPQAPRTHLLYPGTHLSDIRKEAVHAGGSSKWIQIGTITTATNNKVTLGEKFAAKLQVHLRMDDSCQLQLTLPGQPEPIHVTSYLKHILGIELEPAADGTRRILLLAMDEVK